MDDWRQLATELTAALNLGTPPIAITFGDAPPAEVDPVDDPMPPPSDDGRIARRANARVRRWRTD